MSNTVGKDTSSNTQNQEDWRKSVTQSYRSSEIREISKVLAALEPGATSESKMMLAMRFEDSIFQSSESLSDYRKRLKKRLKKLQKSYVPSKNLTSENELSKKKEEDQIERELREKFGESLKYIVKNASRAIEALREKHGKEKADNLKQHTNSIHQWAVEIGLFPEHGAFRRRRQRESGFIKRLQAHLEQRVENIRRHVVNLTDPDRFLEETLARVEEDLNEKSSNELANATLKYINERLKQTPPPADVESMHKLLEIASAVVPPPRQGSEQDIVDAILAYLRKVRSASQIMITFFILDANQKAEFHGVLKKAQAVATEGMLFISKYYKDTNVNSDSNKITLEQAWTKPLQYPKDEKDSNTDTPVEQPPAKRIKLPMIIRTKVLLTPGRNVPANLLAALKAKQAQLIRHGNGAGARLIMSFGSAFEMVIFFVPLLVTIRALDQNEDFKLNEKSLFRQEIVNGYLPTYTSSDSNLHHVPLTICGVTGTSMSAMAAKKLEYASAQATTVLRKCFSEIAGKSYLQSNTSEILYLEANALLKFLQIARSNCFVGEKK